MMLPDIPSYSVLLSIYDGESERFFDQSLESLYLQTLTPDEVILVVDGPIRCELEEVILDWEKKINLNCLRLEKNMGLANALHLGLRHCKNELVGRFDTDDICYSDRFEQQIKFMAASPDVDICGSFAHLIDYDDTIVGAREMPCTDADIKKVIWSNPIVHPSVVFRRSRILDIGSYDCNVPLRHDDYELWIRAVENGLNFFNIDSFLIKYRLPPNAYQKSTVQDKLNTFKIGMRHLLKSDQRPCRCHRVGARIRKAARGNRQCFCHR